MTPEIIANFMISLISKGKNSKVLEPSSGEGVFIDLLKKEGYNDIHAYEIDKELIQHSFVKNESFLSADIQSEYDVIIGNPPYIRWKNLDENLRDEIFENEKLSNDYNKLSDYSSLFIARSIEVLRDDGELIFITPEYWLHTTHSQSLRDFIAVNGCITDLFIFKEAAIFPKVNVSLIVFKFKKTNTAKQSVNVYKIKNTNKVSQQVLDDMLNKKISNNYDYVSLDDFKTGEKWTIASKDENDAIMSFEQACKKKMTDQLQTLNDYCYIGNGMVSGLDKAFQIRETDLNIMEAENTIQVLKAKNINRLYHGELTKYIFIKSDIDEITLRENFPVFYNHFQDYKADLQKRYNYGRQINYWEWVFLRNFNLFTQANKKIFVPCKERISHKGHFRFAIVEPNIYPTQDVTVVMPFEKTKESIEYIAAFLNSKHVFNWLKIKGIIKGEIIEFSRKPTSSIPFRSIDFENHREVEIHNKITEIVKTSNLTNLDDISKSIELMLNQLFFGG